MDNFDCIEDMFYDIITVTSTRGYEHMKNTELYMLVNKDTKMLFEDYIKKDKNCTELLMKMCKHKNYGEGLYVFSQDNKAYLLEEVQNNNKFIIKVNVHFRRFVNLSNPKNNEIDKLLEYEKKIKSSNLPYTKESDFIESLLKVVNIKPDLFKVNYIEKAGLECRVITKFFGSAYFIRKDDIEKVVDSCEIVRLK